MRREEVLSILRSHRSEFLGLGVRSLALFGSIARDQSTDASDVDLLVDFARPIGLFDFVGVQQRLEELLGRRVDLVPRDGIKPRLRDIIVGDAIPVA
jgi:predicted nucleotidyltransferase